MKEKRRERRSLRCYEAWVRSYELWATRREEARRAEDAVREAHEAFQKNFAKLMDKDDKMVKHAMSVANKMWQESKSNHTKGFNLEIGTVCYGR